MTRALAHRCALLFAATVFASLFAGRALAVHVDFPLSDGDDGAYATSPVLVRTVLQAVVHAEPKSWSPMIARIEPGAVFRATPGYGTSGCPEGWLRRETGGFACARRLIEAAETLPRPSPDDAPDLLEGAKLALIGPGGANLYRTLSDIDLRHALVLLFRGSVVTVRDRLRRNGEEYLVTRQGMFARAANAIDLPPPILSLGIDVADGAPSPGAVVIAQNAALRAEPRADAEVTKILARWSAVPAPQNGPLSPENGFVALPGGGFAADDDLARVRPAPRPSGLGDGEKWIAIDIGEQLLHAYVGDRLVRVGPCSTGLKGNTPKGHYRIQWKRRLQTMQLKRGHTRVEDVQWVMYYDKARSIAIHTATWHGEFGRRMSHGCVNLPRDDARWVYEWSSPLPAPEDSETFPHPGDPGTRVVVFD